LLSVLDETAFTSESRFWEGYRAEVHKLHGAELRQSGLEERRANVRLQEDGYLTPERYPRGYAAEWSRRSLLRPRGLRQLITEGWIIEDPLKHRSSRAEERPSTEISEAYGRSSAAGRWLQESGNA